MPISYPDGLTMQAASVNALPAGALKDGGSCVRRPLLCLPVASTATLQGLWGCSPQCHSPVLLQDQALQASNCRSSDAHVISTTLHANRFPLVCADRVNSHPVHVIPFLCVSHTLYSLLSHILYMLV